jgi:hypothetical protein
VHVEIYCQSVLTFCVFPINMEWRRKYGLKHWSGILEILCWWNIITNLIMYFFQPWYFLSSIKNYFQHPVVEHRGRVVILLLRTREVPGSNLDPEPDYPEGFRDFSSVPPGKFRDITPKLGHNRFPPHPLQFFIHLSSFHSTLYSSLYLGILGSLRLLHTIYTTNLKEDPEFQDDKGLECNASITTSNILRKPNIKTSTWRMHLMQRL